MSNLNTELGCRGIGVILKDYSFIVDSMSKRIGVSVGAKDGFGASFGSIANPYYAENDLAQWESNHYKSSSDDYMDYIRKVYSSSMSFDAVYNLSNEELSINEGTESTFQMGTSLSSVLNGIQSFITADNNNGYGSAVSKLYSLHNYEDSLAVVRNYNMSSPLSNLEGNEDTLMANMGVAYRGRLFMDGMLRWGEGGAFADYDRISGRMSRYDFTEANYGYGLNQNFGNNDMSHVGMTHIDDITGPMDVNAGLYSIGNTVAYRQYYKDLGWKSKHFYTTSMAYPIDGVEATELDPTVEAGFASGLDELPTKLSYYPVNRKSSELVSDEIGTNSSVIFDKYTKTYGTGNTMLTNYSMNGLYADDFVTHSQYAEKDHDFASTEQFKLDSRIASIDSSTDEWGYERGIGEGYSDLLPDPTKNNGQAHGTFKAIGNNLSYNDLVSHTNQAFLSGTYESLVARFHTSSKDGKTTQETQTALSHQFGLSHGRNLLKAGVSESQPTITNSYSNPYCRVWTYHHQYHVMENLLRGGGDSNGNVFDTEINSKPYKYPFRAFGNVGENKREDFMNGQDSLNELSVLNHQNNLVNITPKSDDDKFDIKRCMFAIENLAWRDNMKLGGEGTHYYSTLKDNQVGPLGGRIMWFPPYNIDINESVNVGWDQVGSFIGRGEPIKTYKDTTRAGSLSFSIVVDHPAILNYIDRKNKYSNGMSGDDSESVDDTGSTEQTILRFFAGCDVLQPNVPPTPPTPVPEPEPEPEPEPPVKKKKVKKSIEFSVFYPNNYSAYDTSRFNGTTYEQNFCYLANGIGTQLYVEKADVKQYDVVPRKDYKSYAEKIKYLPLTLETKWNVVNPDSDDVVRPWTSLTTDDSTLTKSNEDNYSENAIHSQNDTYYTGSTIHGYEMLPLSIPVEGVTGFYPETENCGISHVSNTNYRFFYPADGEEGSIALSSHTSPIFAIVESDGKRYYMPVDYGDFQRPATNEDISERNDWLYLTDSTTYSKKYGYTNKKGKYVQDSDYTTTQHNKEVLTLHQDYADKASFALNSQYGIDTVNSYVYNGSFSKNDDGYYVSDDRQLVSFADFMVAVYQIVSGENVSNLNVKEGEYNTECVALMKKVLTEGSGKISITGVSNIQGVSNGTTISTDGGVSTDTNLISEEDKEGANFKLANHRAQSVRNYIQELIDQDNINDFDFEWVGVANEPCNDENVDLCQAKANRRATIKIEYEIEEEEETVTIPSESNSITDSSDGEQIIQSTASGRDLNATNAKDSENAYNATTADNTIQQSETETADSTVDVPVVGDTRYEDEYTFFETICNDNQHPFLRDKIREKIRYFDPAYHAVSPEGFNARLTFLHQCTRQGPTYDATNSNNASNMSFGRAPVCVLRLGDFWYSRILITSMNITYDQDVLWDLNPEGIGVQPMIAKVTLGFDFIGGQDLGGPISRLQNAVSFNYYANTRVYDDRAEQIKYDSDKKDPYEFNFVPNQYQ